MSEVGSDPNRKKIESKTGLKFWGYKTRRELASENIIDGLTGLLNRKGWDKKIREYESLAKRTGQKYSFLVADLDGLKEMNDTEGHKRGDELIRRFAEIFKKTHRAVDITARYGGDELSSCLPGTTFEEAEKLKERLLQSAASEGIKVSIGIGVDFQEADQNMYKVKKQSK